MKKFTVSFKKSKDENDKPVTEVKVNRQLVGVILPPNHITFPNKNSTWSAEKFHVTLYVMFLGDMQYKTLKPVFDTEVEAKEYLVENLYSIHKKSHLNMTTGKRKARIPRVRYSEDWLKDL